MFRIEQAIAFAKEQGRPITKKELAAFIWPDSTESGQQVNMTRLCAGRTPRIEIRWVKVICEKTGVDANFLFGI